MSSTLAPVRFTLKTHAYMRSRRTAALYYSTGEHLSMGPGAYIASLEAAARLDASKTLVCGKPTADFFKGCLRDMRGEQALEDERNIVVSSTH